MKVTPIAVAERNYLRGVLRAFLQGKKNDNYVIGCFKNVPIAIFDQVVCELNEFSESPQFKRLYNIRKTLEQHLKGTESKSRWSSWALGMY
ncbi:MAG: hypothetical protein EAX95_00975 [Candidatus Thorarchaeota archaeon]|nr:hypothetical protein [Candidatus Thorarchaeota archaeon]